MRGSKEGAVDLDPHGKSQVVLGFLRNSVTDPFEKQLDPSVKYIDD